jgi:hypothetical protein
MFGSSILARVGVVATGSLLLAGLVAGSSGAATANTKPAKSYFAAYYAYPATVSSVQATITLPTYKCKKTENITAGVGNYDATANAWSSSYVYLGCGKIGHKYGPAYGTGLEVDGVTTYPALTMEAGNSIEFIQTCGPSGSVATIDNLTTTESVTASSSNPGSCADAYAGEDGVTGKGPGGQDPLPPFGAVDYTNVMVNGEPIGTFAPVPYNYYEGKKNVITVGPITDGGTAFVTTQGS